jgi:uncharacterized protein
MSRTHSPPLEAFHAGERALQARTGSRDYLADAGSKILRESMPEPHRELFGKLPFVALGALDAERRPWAEIIAGPPGFVSTPDARTLRIDGRPSLRGPLAHLRAGALVGLLGIELPTRRRNRVNGVVTDLAADHLTVHVHQSFGNCPKYIQVRHPRFVASPGADAVAWQPEGPHLSAAATALIRHADTFFIATATPDASGVPAERSSGVDVSHRGGKPGFVRVTDGPVGDVLTVPDFTGNFFFNTLGNLALDPHAGLLFADFASGDLLTLTGRAEVLWDGPELEGFRGAERLVRFELDAGWYAPGALALRDHGAPEFAAQLSETGSWDEVSERPTPASASPSTSRP